LIRPEALSEGPRSLTLRGGARKHFFLPEYTDLFHGALMLNGTAPIASVANVRPARDVPRRPARLAAAPVSFNWSLFQGVYFGRQFVSQWEAICLPSREAICLHRASEPEPPAIRGRQFVSLPSLHLIALRCDASPQHTARLKKFHGRRTHMRFRRGLPARVRQCRRGPACGIITAHRWDRLVTRRADDPQHRRAHHAQPSICHRPTHKRECVGSMFL
jgi:hypothetical protein